MATEFIGIIPPLMTPFTEAGEIYERGLRTLVDFVVPHVQGLYPCGTYGSGPMMSAGERKRVAEIVLDQVKGRIPVMVHVGTPDTMTTIELAMHAEGAGAQAVGAITPYYNSYDEDAIFVHFQRLIHAVSIPVFLYNNPKTSGNAVTNGVLLRLVREGLAGVKDSTFDIVNYYHMRLALRDFPDMNLIIGTEAILVAAFDAGARAAIAGLANVYPELLERLHSVYLGGDRHQAMELQKTVVRVRQICKTGPTVPVMHAILRMRGVDAGHPRLPFTWISEGAERKVAASLGELGLL